MLWVLIIRRKVTLIGISLEIKLYKYSRLFWDVKGLEIDLTLVNWPHLQLFASFVSIRDAREVHMVSKCRSFSVITPALNREPTSHTNPNVGRSVQWEIFHWCGIFYKHLKSHVEIWILASSFSSSLSSSSSLFQASAHNWLHPQYQRPQNAKWWSWVINVSPLINTSTCQRLFDWRDKYSAFDPPAKIHRVLNTGQGRAQVYAHMPVSILSHLIHVYLCHM